jgi:hypothetical protein
MTVNILLAAIVIGISGFLKVRLPGKPVAMPAPAAVAQGEPMSGPSGD